MYGVVRPVAEAGLSRQSRGAVATDATYTTGFAYAAYTTGLTYTSNAADTAGPTDTTDASHTAGPAHTSDAADATGPTDTTNASHTADTAYSSGPPHTTDAAYGANVIPIEAVVVVDINIATAPAATPAPTAAPPRSHHYSGAEGERGACHVVAGRI